LGGARKETTTAATSRRQYVTWKRGFERTLV
jgi:hypothetical protein